MSLCGQYGKWCKILNTFLFVFANKMLVIRVGTWKSQNIFLSE